MSGLDDLGELARPLSARSIVASVLLGSRPPRLAGRHLVALAARFGVTEGSTRVALSRMVDAGELINDDGTYELAGPLIERRRRQDLQRRPTADQAWSGRWEQAVVLESGRPAAERSRLRKALTAAGLGEAREGVWLRPANVDPPAVTTLPTTAADQLLLGFVEPVDPGAGVELVARLYDLDGWRSDTRRLLAALDQHPPADDIAVGFRLAAACLQHIVHDPLLPAALAPDDWPDAELRRRYDEYERVLQAGLRDLFADAVG